MLLTLLTCAFELSQNKASAARQCHHHDWLVLLGGRYDETRMSSGYAGIFGTGSSQADAKANVVTKREHQFSPKLGLTYKVAPWLSVYGSYTEAFGKRSGNGNALFRLSALQGDAEAKQALKELLRAK